jgi:hypothetical protein
MTDRDVPTDAELPEGPGAKKPPPVRVLHRPTKEDERPFPSKLMSFEETPVEMRINKPPTKRCGTSRSPRWSG